MTLSAPTARRSRPASMYLGDSRHYEFTGVRYYRSYIGAPNSGFVPSTALATKCYLHLSAVAAR